MILEPLVSLEIAAEAEPIHIGCCCWNLSMKGAGSMGAGSSGIAADGAGIEQVKLGNVRGSYRTSRPRPDNVSRNSQVWHCLPITQAGGSDGSCRIHSRSLSTDLETVA